MRDTLAGVVVGQRLPRLGVEWGPQAPFDTFARLSPAPQCVAPEPGWKLS
eukprot:NODE_21434_length_253_cov_3.568627_g20265_i0.p2 GENE.NODE_21434_length_253_cov_3.568627_g20265_i0~~NODE_21434_length_253_cov_3.568627_g20265_i0.p2  ORF type:complete len:50 (+),score=0.12 NODE_21434_length_253_cov_3.568627_g20265_i0:57-206(+)